ncbi:hypothetical protein Pyn_15967 [Prunus yedoensis var. nudiflora]|uniref:Uncharacterized protein n=1 Tax=Prunus yedoensis var. nudiflora TaxID=2094558 RepID=A0A314Y342_PRUYE|nr:hypothetical protein Pyn_15967 [Prunus yedoensis var. nudiflora]
MDNIYGSVESFDSQLFRTEECRAMLLRPRNRTEYLLDNLKLKFDDCEPTRYYQTVPCRRCKHLMDTETTLRVSGAEYGELRTSGFTGWNSNEELAVNVGVDEVLKLLTCSLVSKMPSTENSAEA